MDQTDGNLGKVDLIREAINNQIAFCDKNGYPMFIPKSGFCFCCGSSLFGDGNYTLEESGDMLITGCRRCGRSFVD